MSNRIIMHVDLDSYFVSVEQVLNPELKGKPVVVGGRPGGRGVVATASYEARKFGLYSGMPISTAARLCPHAVFLRGNFTKYSEYSKKFMTILNDFSPFVEPAGIDEAYLDVTGFESLHGSIINMAKKIKHRIQNQLGLSASIGIGSSKVVAKIASDYSKPDGLIEVTPGNECTFLHPLPVEQLPGVGKATLKLMHQLGIRTIGGLSQKPLNTLKQRLGKAGVILHNFADGIDDRPVVLPGEVKSVSREVTFQEDTLERTKLESTLWRQSERIGSDLRNKRKKARCITLKIRFSDFVTITRSHTLKEPLNDDRAIFEESVALLNLALHVAKKRIRLVGIGLSNLVEDSQQDNMFTPSNQKLEGLNKAIDKLRDRYGFDSIQSGRAFEQKHKAT